MISSVEIEINLIKKTMDKIQELIKKAEDKVNSTMLSNIKKTEINLILLEIQKEAINYTRCSTQLKDKEAITFGRYCASRGYHKYEGDWVNRQRIPRDIEWIKKMYNKEIFDL